MKKIKYTVEAYITYPKLLTVYAENLDEAEKRAEEIVSNFTKIVGYSINDIFEDETIDNDE